jgi:hypothetical protein
MKHSVFARQFEINHWSEMGLNDVMAKLKEDWAQFDDDFEALDLPDPLQRPTNRATAHFSGWLDALEGLDKASPSATGKGRRLDE